jgi:RNA polymerase sigma-70 factor (ECF subfamily)
VASDQQLLGNLVDRARDCDPDAWEALYRGAYPKLFVYARRRLATDDQADDAVSEAMTRAIDAIDRFTLGPSGVDGWLFGILRNVVLEIYRRNGRAAPGALGGDERATAEAGPLDTVLAREERHRVRAAFDRLRPEDREVLELRIIGALDADAAGTVLGKRPGAVRMAQSRALGRLKVLLAEDVG